MYSLIFVLEAYPIISYNLSLFYLGFPYLLYVWWYHPFQDPWENRLEVLNQAVIVWCMICAWPMVPGQVKGRDNSRLEAVSGYLVIAGYIVVSIVNISIQVY
jgi:hypothetical protein